MTIHSDTQSDGVISHSTKHHDDEAENTTTEHAIPEEFRRHLSVRLETGRDKFDTTDDPFLKSVNRDHAFVVARKYTSDKSVIQPVRTEMINQPTSKDQLDVLRRMMEEKSQNDCLWINVLGVEERLISGIGELCGLPSHTLLTHIRQSEHRHHRTHIVRNSSYTYIQLLVQDTPKSRDQTPIYDMVKNEFKPTKSQPQPTLSEGRFSESSGNEEIIVDKLIRRGFISIFIIPSVNVLVTITHSYYDCPSSRLVIHTAGADMIIPGQLVTATNAELLGLSMIHRCVGYSSGVIRNIDKVLKEWEEGMKYNLTASQAEEIHRLIDHIHDLKKNLKPLRSVHDKLLQNHEAGSDHKAGQEHANLILHQSRETLNRVLEDVEDLIERSESLENFWFAMLSTRANGSMERLAIVTIVFLPLTFIASYFSMGFEEFPDLTRPPIYFWEISIPLSILFFIIFAYSNLKRGLIKSRTFIKKGRKWVRKQIHWWKLDITLWFKQKRMSWSRRKGKMGASGGYNQP